MQIGFIGQGWIGKHYADDFEARGYSIVRYALDTSYRKNKAKIAHCDIVFIAVPTPTTPRGFDDSIVRAVMPLVGTGKIAVIKSTLLPGTTAAIQKAFPDRFVLHSPEFLVETTAAYNERHPDRNIIGIPRWNTRYREKATLVLSVLPKAPYVKIMRALDAEFVKYAGNCFLFTKVMFMNLLYDTIERTGGEWNTVRDALVHDPRIGESHTEPLHKSGRGAGGHCFIKDFEAFRKMYHESVGDQYGDLVLQALKDKNIELLTNSNKNMDLIRGVYGNTQIDERRKKRYKITRL